MLRVYGLVRIVSDLKVDVVGETKVCTFSVVMKERRKKRDTNEVLETPHFVQCTVWDKAVDVLVKHCKKGNRLMIEGVLRQETWEDKETKQKRQRHVVRISEFNLIDFNNKEETTNEESPVS